MLTVTWETLRLVLAGYLVAVALAATVNLHRGLIAYPWRVLYSLTRVVLGTISFGRIELVPLARQARRSQSRRLRGIRFAFEEIREATRERFGNEPDKASKMKWRGRDDLG
jgi:hypothetical protein